MREKYWKNGVMKGVEELLEEYPHARRRKRDQMCLMFVDLRNEFDEIDQNGYHGCPEYVLNPR